MRPVRPREAADMLGVSVRTIRRYIADGQVPVYRLPSGHVRIRAATITALMSEEEPNSRRHIKNASKSRAELPVNARRSGRRAPLGKEKPRMLFFDTSPEALAEVRASA